MFKLVGPACQWVRVPNQQLTQSTVSTRAHGAQRQCHRGPTCEATSATTGDATPATKTAAWLARTSPEIAHRGSFGAFERAHEGASTGGGGVTGVGRSGADEQRGRRSRSGDDEDGATGHGTGCGPRC